MGSATIDPMSPEEAKQRLRAVARSTDTDMIAWARRPSQEAVALVRRRPLRALVLGFVAGVVYGSSPQLQEITAKAIQHFLLGPDR